MELLASAIWLLIIIHIFVVLRITNKYFIIALLVIVLIELWERTYNNFASYDSKIMLFQGIILILALYYNYGCNYMLVALIIAILFFLYSLVTDKHNDLFAIVILLTFLFVFYVLLWYNRIPIVIFPTVSFTAMVIITIVITSIYY